MALTGSKFGPGIYDIIISLGKEEVEKDYPTRLFLKIVATSLDDEEFDLIPFKV